MEIDHVFMLIEPTGNHVERLDSLGLKETYRRQHKGQGTQNVCFCFDNLFFELLWINDVDEVRSQQIARTKLYERSLWRTDSTNPFGVAWRGRGDDTVVPLATWTFFPPYLPGGAGIEVSIDSDDARQPLMFQSPGSTQPADWPIEKRGLLQHVGGWGRVLGIDLYLPQSIARQTILNLQIASDDQFSMRLHIEKHGQLQPMLLTLPV